MERAGGLERTIRGILAAHPDETFVTNELAEHCYPAAIRIERKHRVAVLRAATKVQAADPHWRGRYASGRGGVLIFYNAASVQSTAMARHRQTFINASRQWLAERTREDQKALAEANREVGEHAVMLYGTPEQRSMVTARREAVGRLETAKLSLVAAVAKNPLSVMRSAQRTAADDMTELAEKARRLMVENDPDAVRAGPGRDRRAARSHGPANRRSDSDGDGDAGGMTRIVTTHYRYKRPPRKRVKAAAIGPSIMATKTVTAIVAALTIAAVVAEAAPADDATLSEWMHGWHQAVDECRGSYPSDPAHARWCRLADSYDAKLKRQGSRLVSLGTSIGSLRWSCPNSVFGDTGQ